MNHQPLNITEQKDMNEFFTDLITKVDEMSPEFVRNGKKNKKKLSEIINLLGFSEKNG